MGLRETLPAPLSTGPVADPDTAALTVTLPLAWFQTACALTHRLGDVVDSPACPLDFINREALQAQVAFLRTTLPRDLPEPARLAAANIRQDDVYNISLVVEGVGRFTFPHGKEVWVAEAVDALKKLLMIAEVPPGEDLAFIRAVAGLGRLEDRYLPKPPATPATGEETATPS